MPALSGINVGAQLAIGFPQGALAGCGFLNTGLPLQGFKGLKKILGDIQPILATCKFEEGERLPFQFVGLTRHLPSSGILGNFTVSSNWKVNADSRCVSVIIASNLSGERVHSPPATRCACRERGRARDVSLERLETLPVNGRPKASWLLQVGTQALGHIRRI